MRFEGIGVVFEMKRRVRNPANGEDTMMAPERIADAAHI